LHLEVLVVGPHEYVLQLVIERPRHHEKRREDDGAQHDDDHDRKDLYLVSAHVAQEFLVEQAQAVSCVPSEGFPRGRGAFRPGHSIYRHYKKRALNVH
jgi:hypothetical protein